MTEKNTPPAETPPEALQPEADFFKLAIHLPSNPLWWTQILSGDKSEDTQFRERALYIPKNKAALKEILLGEDQVDSLLRAGIGFLGFMGGTLAIVALDAVAEIEPQIARQDFWANSVVMLVSSIGQITTGVDRASKVAEQKRIQKEQEQKEAIEEQAAILTERLTPLVEELYNSNQENNPDGTTSLSLYSGSPLPESDIFAIGLQLMPKKGFTTKEVILELKEQMEIDADFKNPYFPNQIGFWFDNEFGLTYFSPVRPWKPWEATELQILTQANQALEAITK